MKKLFFLNFLTVALVVMGCSDETNDQINEPSQCEVATEETVLAAANYNSATAENQAQACNAYKTALQNQKQVCGDENGALQAIINGLGDCTDPVAVEGTLTVTAGSMPINFVNLNVVKENGIIKVSGSSVTNTYTIYFEVAENATGSNILQDFEMLVVSTYYPVAGDFTTNVTVNNDGTLTGTFHGLIKNNDNGVAELTNGNFNLNY